MSVLEVAAMGFGILIVVLLVFLWCWPGLFGAPPRPKWRGWWRGGDE